MTADGPLVGVRILDVSRLLPGGACTRLLGDLGAEIVKIERPDVGDDLRHEHPFIVEGVSAVHQYVDAGKRSVALNLKDPDDLEVALRLAASCDAVLESFRPGVADKLGIGFDAVAHRNPAAVYVSLSGYGQDGPRVHDAGHDIDYLAYAGVLSTVGSREGGPALSGVLVADMMGGTLAATAILAGIVQARDTGRGGHVDLALMDAAAWALCVPTVQHLGDGRTWAPEEGMLNGGWPSYRVYRCADGRHLAVGALEQRFWERLLALLGRPNLASRRTDPTAVEELDALFATRDRAHWLDLLEGNDTCVAPVLDLAAAVSDPHRVARGGFTELSGDGWSIQQPTVPIRFDGHVPTRMLAPELGAHNAWARETTDH